MIIGLAIPISVIGTFVVMRIFGRSLNVVSLAGLAFAVGMVVDNAIVVLENIDRHLNMGKAPMRAAYDAAQEVWGAVLASTLTTLAVFVPVLTLEEEAGQLFRDIALAICAAVALSLMVSITVIPSASSRFLRAASTPQTPWATRFKELFGLSGLAGSFGATRRGVDLRRHRPDQSRGVDACRGSAVVYLVRFIGRVDVADASHDVSAQRATGTWCSASCSIRRVTTCSRTYRLVDRVESIVRPYWEATTMQQTAALDPVI